MNKKGFIAFSLVIFISTIILTFSFYLMIEYGQFFDMTMTKEYRLMSYYNAYSCIDQAIQNLSEDFFFLTGKNIEYKDLNCEINSIIAQNDKRIIIVTGKYKNIVQKRIANTRLFDDHIEVLEIE